MLSVYTILQCHDPGIQYERPEKRSEGDRGLLPASIASPRGFPADKGGDLGRGERGPVEGLRAKTVGEKASDQMSIALAGAGG
jgi:hypothetical protein